jgi:polysaccharide export outer membrane protein
MFKQKDYEYFELAQKQNTQYTIQPGDEFTLKVYARDGFKIIDVLGGRTTAISEEDNGQTVSGPSTDLRSRNQEVPFIVDPQGFAKIPIIGFFYVKGYTEVELERIFAEKFSGLFVDPYAIVTVKNRRVFVFKSGSSQVVPLNDYPTSLIEVLSISGGLSREFKSYNIKIIRGDIKNPQVQIVDLSTLEGIRKADLAMQPNDIVYIDERRRVATELLREIAPYISLLSSTVTVIFLVQRFGK